MGSCHDSHDAMLYCAVCLCCFRKELGSLRLKVQCSEERILEASLYDHFVKLMLDTVDNPTVTSYV